MSRVRGTLEVSRESLGVTAWLLSAPVGVVAAPLAAYPALTTVSEFARWFLIGMAAQLALGVVLLIGAKVTKAVPFPQVATVLITMLAGAARGLVIAVLGQTPDVFTRVCASAITMSIWLVVIGSALRARRRYRDEVEMLLAQLVARELHGRLLDEQAVDVARQAVAERIAEASGQVRVIVDAAADDHRRTSALLQSAIEVRLRPLSHDLWFSPNPIPPVAHRRLAFLTRTLRADLPVMTLFVAAMVLLSWGSLVLHGTWRGLIVGASIAVAYGVTLALGRWLPVGPTARAVIRYLGVTLMPAAVGSMAITALHLGHTWSPIAVVLGLPLITFGVAAAATIRADRADIVADLRARLAEPDWDRHLGDLVRRQVDANAATIVHNAMQPALTAAALQLQLAAVLDEPGRARSALDRALRVLDDVERPGGLESSGRQRLDQVAEAWQGIATVRLALPDASLSRGEWALLADIVDESIANAVRHGHARSIGIDVSLTKVAIVVAMTDDGTTIVTRGNPGLGTTWLDSVAVRSATTQDQAGRRRQEITVPRAGLPLTEP